MSHSDTFTPPQPPRFDQFGRPVIDREQQIVVIRMAPATPTARFPGLTAYFTVEVGRLIQVSGFLYRYDDARHGDSWRVKLATTAHRRERIDFAPPIGRLIVRGAVVAAWEARP